ncbi:DinB family protein [Paenibacillus sp. QZ-Y1]|uniref:DinB family protein n=1 Tax=Paenibacillus sp. QZ-Y1 TaxID=3414511 RepID=UPI003F78BC33
MKGLPLHQTVTEQHGPMIDENGKLPMVQEVSLNSLLSTYEGVITMLKDECTQLTDDDLTKLVTFGHENEKQATIRWGIWHIADHSRYHQAHMNQLRRWYLEAR